MLNGTLLFIRLMVKNEITLPGVCNAKISYNLKRQPVRDRKGIPEDEKPDAGIYRNLE